MAEKKEKSIEESFRMLDEMVKKLEDEDLPLEDSFRTYEEGMKLLKEVNGRIDTVEKKMQKIAETARQRSLLEETAGYPDNRKRTCPVKGKSESPDHGGHCLRRRNTGKQARNIHR